jgi:hypothetical protein
VHIPGLLTGATKRSSCSTTKATRRRRRATPTRCRARHSCDDFSNLRDSRGRITITIRRPGRLNDHQVRDVCRVSFGQPHRSVARLVAMLLRPNDSARAIRGATTLLRSGFTFDDSGDRQQGRQASRRTRMFFRPGPPFKDRCPSNGTQRARSGRTVAARAVNHAGGGRLVHRQLVARRRVRSGQSCLGCLLGRDSANPANRFQARSWANCRTKSSAISVTDYQAIGAAAGTARH